MRWYYPTLSQCPWAQEALAQRDIWLNEQHKAYNRGCLLIWGGETNPLADLDEWFAMKYVETGNPAWLNLWNNHRG